MSRVLRILVLADARSFHTIRYVRELRRQGCCVLTASLEGGPMVQIHLKRIGPVKGLHYYFATRQVRKIISRFKPDIVNAHFATGYGWLASRAIAKSGSPLALHLWGSDILQVPDKSFLHRKKAQKAVESAALVIGDSKYLIDEASKIGYVKKSRVVYWGLERIYLTFADTRREFGVPLKIIMPRHHEPVYNNQFALRALAPMLRAGIVLLTVPSWGSLVEAFRSEQEALGIENVQYYDRRSRDQFMLLMSQHDVYLSASRSDSSPASLIEACGLGLVPVAANIAGVREWMDDDGGFLFEPENEESLRQATSRILESTDSCATTRARNHERVRREAIFENNVADTLTAMASLVGGRV